MGPASPVPSSRSASVSHAPRMLLPLSSSMTPPPRYASPSPSSGVIGPPPAPRPVSQSTPWLPAPAAGSLAASSPPPVDHVPTSINLLSLVMGRLPATPSGRSERRVSHTMVSVGMGGLPSPGFSTAGESPRLILRTMMSVRCVGKPYLPQPPQRLSYWIQRVSRRPRPWLRCRRGFVIMGYLTPGLSGLPSHGIKLMGKC